tara:strand:- start:84 stop:224 length:141 start_codon:yes stop_codon:yes gene_type:complete
MYKTIRISNLVYEMLVVVAKKHRPMALKPETMIEEIIEDKYRALRK